MSAYYNEIDPYAAQWLRNLVSAGHIAPGDVDERSIKDVAPDDLRHYTQCHFFAGIGGWSYAARLAGWPDDRALWTGSCPCQPFSTASAGRREGTASEKHLWPAWRQLIRSVRPPVIFGEQVTSSGAWTDQVWDEMEFDDYAFWPVDIAALTVGADHIRDRRWFLAHSNLRAEYVRSEYAEAQMLSRRDCVSGGVLSAHGISLGLAERSACKGFGNAIVPQVAAEVISAYLDAERGRVGLTPEHGWDMMLTAKSRRPSI